MAFNGEEEMEPLKDQIIKDQVTKDPFPKDQIIIEDAPVSKPSGRQRVVLVLKDNSLILANLLAVIIGIAVGLGLRQAEPPDDVFVWLGLPGELFLRCFKATVVPLVVSMVITCTSSLDPKSNGKIAAVALFLFFMTHVVAGILAICFFFVFKPSGWEGSNTYDHVTTDFTKNPSTQLTTQDVFLDLIRNIFPDNVITAVFSQVTTTYKTKSVTENLTKVYPYNTSQENMTSFPLPPSQTRERVASVAEGSNILGLITVSAAVGIAASQLLKPDSEFLMFFRQAQDIIFLIIKWLFWTTPVGVASLIISSLGRVGDTSDLFYRLGLLMASVNTGIVVHSLLVVPFFYFILTRRNPYLVVMRCVRSFVIVFASSLTSVALPDMLRTCDRCSVDRKVSSFVIPISMVLHADNCGLYITSAALFICLGSPQGLGVDTIFTIGALTPVLCHAIPPVPSASLITLMIVLTSLNYPLQDVALLFALEWLMDRVRTAFGVITHILVAVATDSLCTSKRKMTTDQQERDGNGNNGNCIEIYIPEKNGTLLEETMGDDSPV